MSTLRVQSDQENLSRAKDNAQEPLQSLQQQKVNNKRAVLGLLHSNCQRNSKNVINNFISLFSKLTYFD